MRPGSISFDKSNFDFFSGMSISTDIIGSEGGLLSVATPGQTRDFTRVYELHFDGTTSLIDITRKGAMGIDVVPFSQNKIYSIYLIADTVGGNRIAFMCSLDPITPIMPTGYDLYKRIGYVRTGNIGWLPGNWIGDGLRRTFWYDAPQIIVNAFTPLAYTKADLTDVVPNPVFNGGFEHMYVQVEYTAPTPGASLSLRATGMSSQSFDIKVPSGEGLFNFNFKMPYATDPDGPPTIEYKGTTLDAVVTVKVQGFEYGMKI